METLTVEKKPAISVEDFLAMQSQTEKVLEYSEGEVFERSGMKNTERLIVDNLLRKFSQTEAYKKRASLLPETDCWLSEKQMRRPDLAFFTREQILEAAEGKQPVPAFVIEIISENDTVSYVENKVLEYQQAGVKVIWHIYPELKVVKVIRGKEARYFEGDEAFDASPVIPDLKLSVRELFEK